MGRNRRRNNRYRVEDIHAESHDPGALPISSLLMGKELSPNWEVSGEWEIPVLEGKFFWKC